MGVQYSFTFLIKFDCSLTGYFGFFLWLYWVLVCGILEIEVGKAAQVSVNPGGQKPRWVLSIQ
jgi:hypothetical protein